MNILIIKIGALGDVVRTSFIAQALRDKYRDQNPAIFWIANEDAKPLFVNKVYIDNLLISKDKNQLKGINFDLVVNLEEDKENAKLVSDLKPKKIIGVFLNEKGEVDYTPDSSPWFDMSMISKFGRKKADLLKIKNKKTHRELMAKIMDVNPEKFEPFLRLNEYQRKIACDFLRRYNLSRTDLIIGVNTGAADRWPKSLPVKKTVQLIDEIYKKYNARILLFGGPNEIERNREIIKLTKSPIIDTGSGNDLIEFPALISICSLFITTDSLGLHISLALKRKTICLIGPTLPNEIGMYGHGKRIVAKSKCAVCLKKDCKSMEKIDIKEVNLAIKELLTMKISIVITAFNEPKIGKAIEAALNQKTNYEYDILVSVPDKETLKIVNEYAQKNKKIKVLKDPGKGKSYALNLIFSEIKSDILILTDGDVWISDNSVEDISNLFLDPEIGCITGNPTPVEGRKTKYGYWANFLFYAAHLLRKNAFEKNSFIECSGYLFAFRKNKINDIPLDTAEDTIIPYYFWERGYRIGYAESARVYVKNVNSWKEWIKQKTRTSKAHMNIQKYADTKTTPKVKSFKNEAKGISLLLSYPENFMEILWTSELILARLYMWYKVFLDTKIKKRHYQDSWERVESAR